MKKFKFTNSERIKKALYDNINMMSMTGVEFTCLNDVWFIKIPERKTDKLYHEVLDKLKKIYPKKTRIEVLNAKTFLIGWFETDQDKYNFLEVVAAKKGEKLVEKQKEVLAMKQEWSDILSELVSVKNDIAKEVV